MRLRSFALAALPLVASQTAPAPLTVQDLHARFLSVARGKSGDLWPGFDPARYVLVAREEGSADSVLRFSPDPSAAKPEVFMVVDAAYVRSHSLEDDLALVFHEAFHAFEGDKSRSGARWRSENASLLFEYSDSTPRNDALLGIESRLLGEALRAKEGESLRSAAAKFLAMRRLRQGELEPRFVEFEKGLESNEGLAEYAGFRGVSLAIGVAASGAVALPLEHRTEEAFLGDTFKPLASIGESGKNPRRRFYFTGSAQAFLLDRLLPEWKRRVQQDAAALQDLLAEAAGGEDPEKVAAAVLEGAGYEAALEAATKAAAKRRDSARALRESVLGKGGLRVVVEVAGGGAIRSFDPMNVVLVEGGGRVHTRMLEIGGPANLRADFERALVQETKEGRFTTVFEPADRVSASVDGRAVDLSKPGEHRGPRILVEGPGLKVTADEGVLVVERDRVLVRGG
ncbi:MAG TPA: hypothetical protein VFI25_06060 [Planctomycetota bacterium]|jgi:hypothetical protein|nr:hypothetical protein [Planctomycetota bacterium]